MKLLIVTQTLDINDANLGFFHRWVDEFAQQCDSVIVICLEEGYHVLPENVTVCSLGKEVGAGRVIRLIRFLRYIIGKRAAYTAVFVHMNPIYVVLGGLTWRIIGKRIGLWYTHKSVTLKLRLATLLAHDIFTASPESFRIHSSKKQIVGHGVDIESVATERVNTNHSDTFSLVTVGRISRIKDIDVIISALHRLKDRNVPVELTVVGAPRTDDDERYEQELRRTVSATGLYRRVTFVGGVSHEAVSEYLSTADAFVSASRTDSLDKALLEAAAMGLPIITSNKAARTLCGENVDLLMVPSRSESELAERIEKLAELEPSERDRIGDVLARRVRRDHTLTSLVGRIVARLFNS